MDIRQKQQKCLQSSKKFFQKATPLSIMALAVVDASVGEKPPLFIGAMSLIGLGQLISMIPNEEYKMPLSVASGGTSAVGSTLLLANLVVNGRKDIILAAPICFMQSGLWKVIQPAIDKAFPSMKDNIKCKKHLQNYLATMSMAGLIVYAVDKAEKRQETDIYPAVLAALATLSVMGSVIVMNIPPQTETQSDEESETS